jgi:Flp pilus assembly pilin Flp
MQSLLSRFWHETRGAVLTSEFVLVATIAVAGLLAGLEGLRDLMNAKLHGMSQAVRGIDQQTFGANSVTHEWVSRPPITPEELEPFATYEIPDDALVTVGEQ